MERIKFLGTFVDNLTMEETIEEVDKYIYKNKPLHLIGVNADKINELSKDFKLRKLVNECGIINADGASVVWASKVLHLPIKERVAGIDLMLKLVKLAEKKKYSIYLLGAKQEVVEKTAETLQKSYPGLHIAGYRNGYFTESEWPQIAEEIEKSKAQLVFVGISSPMKEYLIEYFQKRNMNQVFMGVGGSFDVISGNIPRAPEWVQKIGMEWFFRFLQEPQRLWKRYLIGNTIFVFRVYREKFRKSV
ncbi:MAG: WecB/TagA/CpsF family glycosyltransferase [Lachnospiraceae bacterium]|nr:WecB/TagA/CpsF family glycosyltransferase [Lachnospiraceae bacterium]